MIMTDMDTVDRRIGGTIDSDARTVNIVDQPLFQLPGQGWCTRPARPNFASMPGVFDLASANGQSPATS